MSVESQMLPLGTEAPDFTHRERGKIVMEHETFFSETGQIVDVLFVIARTKRHCAENLRLTTLK